MAKSKHKKKKNKGSSAPKRDALSRSGMLSSKFITRMRATILSPEQGVQLWGEDFANPRDKKLIAEDLANAFRSLFLHLEVPQAMDAGTPGSATKLLAQLVTETGWPDNDADFPTPRPWEREIFQRYEVVCAANILMNAYNRHFPGGGPTWPPERPK